MPSTTSTHSNASPGNLKPRAAPPAASPPQPPSTPSNSDSSVDSHDAESRTYSQQSYSSYQKASNVYSSRARNAAIPTITNYGVSPVITIKKEPEFYDPNTMLGDPNLRPNTGETNDDYGGIGSLREVATRLRWMTIFTTILTILWEGFALPTRIILETWIDPGKVVLAAYLGVFSLLVLGVELNASLRDSFGFIYNPLGRGALLYLMSSMCFGILHTWWESLLGVALILCGTGYFFAYFKYPEYSRWYDYNENHVWQDVRSVMSRTAIGRRVNSWSRPTAYDASDWLQTQRETQSLLTTV